MTTPNTPLPLPLDTAEKIVRQFTDLCPDLLLALAMETILDEYDARGRNLDDIVVTLADACAERDSLLMELEIAAAGEDRTAAVIVAERQRDEARSDVADRRAQLLAARRGEIQHMIAAARTEAGIVAPVEPSQLAAARRTG